MLTNCEIHRKLGRHRLEREGRGSNKATSATLFPPLYLSLSVLLLCVLITFFLYHVHVHVQVLPPLPSPHPHSIHPSIR